MHADPPSYEKFLKKVSTESCACNFFWIDTLLDTIHIVRGKQAISDCHKTLTKLFCFWFFRKCTVTHFEWRKKCKKILRLLYFLALFRFFFQNDTLCEMEWCFSSRICNIYHQQFWANFQQMMIGRSSFFYIVYME